MEVIVPFRGIVSRHHIETSLRMFGIAGVILAILLGKRILPATVAHHTRKHCMDLPELLISLLNIYSLVLLARALMSWFDPTFSSAIGRVVYQMTEPVVAPVRQVLPSMGGLDFSIMVTIFLCIILQRMIASMM